MNDRHPDCVDRSRIQARLADLQAERAAGARLLADLEARAMALREQLLRIDGAAQALAELLAACGAPPPAPPGPPAALATGRSRAPARAGPVAD